MNKDNTKKKATPNDVQHYNMLSTRLDELGKNVGTLEEWTETIEQILELESELDWTPVLFEEGGKQGLKDFDGSIIVPARFDAIVFTYPRYNTLSSRPAIVRDRGKFGLVKTDGTGDMVLSCEHDNIEPVLFDTKYYIVSDGGRKGMIQSDGTILIPQIADIIFDFNLNIVLFKSNNKYGLWSMAENIYIEPVYDELRPSIEEPVIAEKDGIIGYLSAKDGHFIKEDDFVAAAEEPLIGSTN